MTGILPLDPQMTQSWTFKRSPMFEELDTYGVNGRVSLQAVGQGWAYVDYEFFVYPLEHLKTSTVYYSILEITLPRQLPHIIFDSKQMNGRQMHLSFDAGQKIELEGNFSMFFDTYFPATYHIDLLSIVSPEVMEALIEAKEFDIEIYGSSLRLYGPMQTPAEVQRLMQLGFLIRDKLMNNIVTYSDQRIAIKPREQIHTHGLQIQSNFRLNAVSLFIGSLISFGISCWVLYALFTLPFNLLRYSKITILLIGCSALSIALFVGGISTLKHGRKERQERRNTRPN